MSASSSPRTLVIIPAKDEAESLPAVLAGLRASESGFDVVVVDDGSTDATAAVARAGGATVLSLPFNLGIGGALRTGFRYAVRNGYQRGVQFDGDGQHDPTQIGVLLTALDDGADMAIGNRFGGHSHTYELGRVRARAMSFMRFIVRQFSGQQFTDTSSGFRAFDRDVLEFFARNYPAEYLESVEALLLASGAGFRVDEVPVRMHNREMGAPSNQRFKLLYHYLRLLLVISVSANRRKSVSEAASRRRQARDDREQAAGATADAEPTVPADGPTPDRGRPSPAAGAITPTGSRAPRSPASVGGEAES